MIGGCTLKMRTSSEIITVSKRAAKASGFSWGVSEEIGKNIKDLTRKEKLKRYVARRVSSRMVSIVAFTLGVAWMFCLPVVSVVTGELKVRGTYFDETTLSPMAARATLHTSEGFRAYLRKRHGSFCDELIALLQNCTAPQDPPPHLSSPEASLGARDHAADRCGVPRPENWKN